MKRSYLELFEFVSADHLHGAIDPDFRDWLREIIWETLARELPASCRRMLPAPVVPVGARGSCDSH
jgi:hypothetical protein